MTASGWLLPAAWTPILGPDAPLLETFLRVTAIYLFLIVLLRVVLKREAAGLSQRDFLVLVLLADAVQNGMAGPYGSVANAAVAGATLILWDYTLSWLEFRWPALRRLLEPAPLALIRDGKLLRRNMAQEMVTGEELLAQLRRQGLSGPEEVRLAVMESDGQISVIPRAPRAGPPPPRRGGPGGRRG